MFLDAEEVAAFSDRFFSSHMTQEHIPGALFLVVQDGQVVFEQGYGYADLERQLPMDPEYTVFRVGSISKLFAATAVMQLVEEGKLDLHRDVRQDLDELRQNRCEGVTLDRLLTHTAGLDESFVGILARNAGDRLSLREYLSHHLPPCVLPPGEILRYSNQGYALIGYLVEKAAGMPFVEYAERYILQPLHMDNSSFVEVLDPQPSDRGNYLATGYRYRGQDPKTGGDRYEPFPLLYTNDVSSGALSATVADLAHFIIANLEQGSYRGDRILQPASVETLHQQHFTHHPLLPGQGYGFYERYINGHRALGNVGLPALEHDGHLPGYNCKLLLIPEARLGLFVAFNQDKGNLDSELVEEFCDRYCPDAPPLVPEDPPKSPLARGTLETLVPPFSRGARGDLFARADSPNLGTPSEDPPKSPLARGTSTADPPKSPLARGTLETLVPPFSRGARGDRTIERWRGTYRYIRYPWSGIEKLAALIPGSPISVTELQVEPTADGTLAIGTTSTEPERDRPQFQSLDDTLFQSINGSSIYFRGTPFSRVAFRESDRDTYLFLGKFAFQKLSWYDRIAFHEQAPIACLLVFLADAVIGFILFWRKRFKKGDRPPSLPPLMTWLTRGVCVLNLAFCIGFSLTLWWIDPLRLAYGIPAIVTFWLSLPLVSAGSSVTLLFLVLRACYSQKPFDPQTFWGRWRAIAISLTGLGFAWFLNYWNLLGFRF